MITTSYETAYKLAFKCVYHKLPAWKKRAYDEDKVAGKLDSAVMVEVAEAVEAHVNEWEADPGKCQPSIADTRNAELAAALKLHMAKKK
ncbi:MAG: hypothetical protein ACYSUV_02055 [Planctomycetota bacterium]|jgi:hypothetical protein